MSGPSVSSTWAKIAAQKSAANAAQQASGTQQAPKSAPSETNSTSKDDSASTSAASVAISVAETNDISKSESQASPVTPMSDLKKALANSTFADEVTAVPSAVPHRDDEASVAGSLATLATNAEKTNKATNPLARVHDDANSRKSRKPKRSRHAEKENGGQAEKTKEANEEPPKPIEYIEATVPIVNIWHKRQAEQSVKKPATTTPPVPTDNATMANGVSKPGNLRTAAGAANSAADALSMNGSVSGSSKLQRPSVETSRGNDNQQLKRNAPRGNRAAEKDEKTVNGTVVADATSWPTPATLADDKKPKATPTKEQIEDESNPAKPAQKTTWNPMPFVHSVNFQTPMPNIKGSKPRGGGRGGRDTVGRGGHTVPAGAQQSEKTAISAVTGTNKTPESREKKETPGPDAQGANSAKRVPGDQAVNGRDPRKSVSPPNRSRSRELPIAEQTTDVKKADAAARGSRHEHVNGDSATLPRNSVGRKSPEYSGHAGFTPSKDGPQPNRERGEGRGERGSRGGAFRRGGAHGAHTNQGHLSQSPYTYNSRFPTNPSFQTLAGGPQPFTSPPAQFGFGPPPAPKHGRGNARSQSLSTTTPFSNQVAGPRSNIPRMSSLQTGPGFFESQYPLADPAHQYPMSAGPYVAEPTMTVELYNGVLQQVEYYFSDDNLPTDSFLRKSMDSQGFVPVKFVADFPRMYRLCTNLGWVTYVCQTSEKLDVITNEQGVDLVRARHIWDKYTLSMDSRVETARHNGPDMTRVLWKSTHASAIQAPTYNFYPTPQAMPHMFHTASPTTMGGYPPITNGVAQSYSPYTNGVQADVMTNGNGVNGAGHQEQSQLSANVPDFSPTGTYGKDVTLEGFQKISDADIEQWPVRLTDVVVNGTHGPGSEASSDENSAMSVAYPELRSRAMDDRSAAEPGDTPQSTKQLYTWWAAVLPENFNISMYEAFRNLAIEDAKHETPRLFGIKKLVAFYNELMDGNAGSHYPNVFPKHRDEAEHALLHAPRPVMNGSPQK